MNLEVSVPLSAKSVTSQAGGTLRFAFDPSSASFERAGSDLAVTPENGQRIVIEGYFAVGEKALPSFTMPDGATVAAKDFFTAVSADLDLTATAAGPAASAQSPASGGTSYDDAAGDLLGGVNRLGSLGTDHWSRETEEPEYAVGNLSAGLPESSAGVTTPVTPLTPPAPVPTPEPVEPIGYNARAVVYTHDAGASHSVTLDALSYRASTQVAAKAADASGVTLTLVDIATGEPVDPTGKFSWVLNADGTFTITLDPSLANETLYIEVSGSGPSPYVLQVIGTTSKTFDSESQDTRDIADGILRNDHLIHGEGHSGESASETGYKTTSSNLDDDLDFTGTVKGVIHTGHAGDRADWGTDEVRIQGTLAADKSTEKTDLTTGTSGSVSIESAGAGIRAASSGTTSVLTEKAFISGITGMEASNKGANSLTADEVNIAAATGMNAVSLGKNTIATTDISFSGSDFMRANGNGSTNALISDSVDMNLAAGQHLMHTAVRGANLIENTAKGTGSVTLAGNMTTETDYGTNTVRVSGNGDKSLTLTGDMNANQRGTNLIELTGDGKKTVLLDGDVHNTYWGTSAIDTTKGHGAADIHITGSVTQAADANFKVNTGSDNDLVRIDGSINTAANRTYINLGEGSDTFSLGGGTFVSGGGYGKDSVDWSNATAQTLGGTVTMGKGSDIVTVSGKLTGTVTLGESTTGVSTTGTNDVNAVYIKGQGEGNIYGDAGQDILNVRFDTESTADIYALRGTTNLGEGNNLVDIKAIGGNAQGLRGNLFTGSGDDTIRIEAQSRTGVGGNLNAGEGDNLLYFVSHSAVHSLNDIHVTTGAGNDTIISIGQGGSSFYGGAYRMNAGDGDNVIHLINGDVLKDNAGSDIPSVDAASTKGTGLAAATLQTGNGNDFIHIEAGHTGIGGVLVSGAGNDTLDIRSYAGSAVNSTTVYMGYTANAPTFSNHASVTQLVRQQYGDAPRDGSVITAHGLNGVSGSKLYTSDFDDTISLVGDNVGVSSSTVDMNQGFNRLNIEGRGNLGVNNSKIYGGDQGNEITVAGSNGGIGSTTISTGSGNDVVAITETGAFSHGAAHSLITSTGGSDTVSVTAGRYGLAMSTIDMKGDGRDYISIEAKNTTTQTNASADNSGGSAIYSAHIKGESAITLTVKGGVYAMFASARASGSTVDGADDASVTGGSRKGDLEGDNFSFQGKFGTQIEANELKLMNYVKTGLGNDIIRLDGSLMYQNRKAVDIKGTTDATVADYDTLILTAPDWTEFNTRYEAWMKGNFASAHIESVQVDVTGAEFTAVPAWLTTLTANAGAQLSLYSHVDTLEGFAAQNHVSYHADLAAVSQTAVFGDGDDRINAESLDNGDLNLGNGHNILHVAGDASGHISAGSSDDLVTVGGTARDLHVDTGAGNDQIHIEGSLEGASSLHLGAGDDLLVMEGFKGGTIDGGSGHDVLSLKLDGSGGTHAFETGGDFAGLFKNGAAGGFEELRLDLEGGAADVLSIDDAFLGNLKNLAENSDNGGLKVFVTGNALENLTHGADSVSFAGDSSNWTRTVDGDYTVFTSTENTELQVLVQTNLLQ